MIEKIRIICYNRNDTERGLIVMLCEYLYDTTGFNRYGWFQCDTVDFKQFWHAYNHNHINRCYVKLNNGTIWLWTRETKNWQTTLIAPVK